MSRLFEIQSRIEALPELQKQKQNNAKVSAFTRRIEIAFDGIKERVEQRSFHLTVFPDVELKKTIDALKQSKLQASRLIDKLKEDFDAIGTPDTDKKITRIGDRINEAKDELEKTWKKQLENELQPLSPLVEIAREAKLPGYEQIVGNRESLQARATNPPNNIALAIEIRAKLDSLRKLLGNLNLEGRGGEFLKKAVKGTAKPKELLNEEVRRFLDENNLWDILTISVG